MSEKKKRKLNIKTKFIGVFLCITLVAISSYLIFYQDKLTASTIVVMRDFRLKAENRWSGEDKKSFAYLEWDNVKDIDKTGYQLYQSEDGNSWSVRSLNYGKAIKVLNIYPDLTSSNNLKVWMDSLDLKILRVKN